MHLCESKKIVPRARPRPIRIAGATLLAVGLLGAAGATQAACLDPLRAHLGVRLPVLKADGNGAPRSGTAQSPSIVGLWHVTYTAPDGSLAYQSFDVWHSDGTEFETADLSPVIGAVCVGVWKQTGPLGISLNHFGWSFDDAGNAIGSFNLIETIDLHRDGNTYTGSFDLKQYDAEGNIEPADELTGTITATRITVDQHGAD